MYIITALRNTVCICRNDKKGIYIGNVNIATFKTKEEAKKFMKTKKFKWLDSLVPLVWNITEVKEKENIK